MAVIADRVKTHPSHASTIADDVERIDNEAELIVTKPTTISSKAVGASEVLTGPGYFNLDFSLGKNIPVKQLGDSGVLEFRGEFFNILNHPNFALNSTARQVFAGTANGEAPLSTAGMITTTVSVRSRPIQFALKLLKSHPRFTKYR